MGRQGNTPNTSKRAGSSTLGSRAWTSVAEVVEVTLHRREPDKFAVKDFVLADGANTRHRKCSVSLTFWWLGSHKTILTCLRRGGLALGTPIFSLPWLVLKGIMSVPCTLRTVDGNWMLSSNCSSQSYWHYEAASRPATASKYRPGQTDFSNGSPNSTVAWLFLGHS